MKIILIIPPRPYLFKQKALPYIGVLTVSSSLKKAGHYVTVLDFADEYRYIKAEWYSIYSTNADFKEAVKVKNWIKGYNPEAKIAIGGPMATYSPKECQKEFEYVLAGDGETFDLFIMSHKKLSFGYISDIDQYHPDKKALNLLNYEFYVNGIRATSMVTSYSCAYGKCAFCSRPPSPYNKCRFHSVQWCADEIKEISDLGFKALMVYDDEFFTNPRRDSEIIEHLGTFDAWRCFVRTDYVLRNKSLVIKAAENNLKEVLIGIESGSNKVLESINKGITANENLDAVSFLHSLGIKVKCAMIIGLPSESENTLKETWHWCELAESDVFDWDFTLFTPLPSSDIYEHTEHYDIQFDKDRTLVPYKAMNMESEICPIRTSDLNFNELSDWRNRLEKRFKLKKEVILA